MDKPILNEYFKNLEKLLADAARFSGVTGKSTESGKNREILVGSVLKQHLPCRASTIQGGIVIDSHNKNSHQIDSVVCNSFSFVGGSLEYGLIPVEAIIAAIEIKSTIDSSNLKKSFNQLDAVKKLKKEIDRSMYDGSEDIAARTRRALTIGWFWKGDMKIGTACKYLINPKRYIKERRFGGNRPNCIYVHNEYLLISDPCPDEKLGEGSGKPNNFLKEFRDKPGVLRGKQYLGTGGTKRDIYHFETTDWQTIEVFLMWLCHEVDRYIWEIPNFAAYVRKNKITNNYV
ncbi:MAG: DUF6602 domain-containing protein [Syntrophales bacterium]